MDIYSILTSIPHNEHHIKRYISFVMSCANKNKGDDGYYESHHICPKAADMFPMYSSETKNPWNIVKLTGRQHYIAHMMLSFAYPDARSQQHALWFMSLPPSKTLNEHRTYTPSSKQYERARKNHAEAISSDRARAAKISAAQKAHVKTEEHRNNISRAKKGVPQTQDAIARRKKGWETMPDDKKKAYSKLQSQLVSDRMKTMSSEERRAKFGNMKNRKPAKIVTCPHCSKTGGARNMSRYHFDNCKSITNKS